MTPVHRATDGGAIPTVKVQEATPKKPAAETASTSTAPVKKFAKTLRLTSDQLVSFFAHFHVTRNLTQREEIIRSEAGCKCYHVFLVLFRGHCCYRSHFRLGTY